MKFEIVTLFPDYFGVSLRQSLLGRALEKKLFEIQIINLRDYAIDRHGTVDDRPFGGGGGMVLKVDVLDRCLEKLGYAGPESSDTQANTSRIVVMSAAGVRFDQRLAVEYSLYERLTIVCGHYLGIDERLLQLYNVDEVSIGDFTLTGGEPAAAVIVDAVARLIPQVLGNFESALEDSFMDGILGTPCYTRPAEYKGMQVPQALLSGDHKEVGKYRRAQAVRKCLKNRRDLLKTARLSDDDMRTVGEIDKTIEMDWNTERNEI